MSTAAQTVEAPFLLESLEQGVLTLTLNRGRQLNPLSEDMLAALTESLSTTALRSDVRAVVIAAEGKGFCAGHDLKQMRSNHGSEYTRPCSSAVLG